MYVDGYVTAVNRALYERRVGVNAAMSRETSSGTIVYRAASCTILLSSSFAAMLFGIVRYVSFAVGISNVSNRYFTHLGVLHIVGVSRVHGRYRRRTTKSKSVHGCCSSSSSFGLLSFGLHPSRTGRRVSSQTFQSKFINTAQSFAVAEIQQRNASIVRIHLCHAILRHAFAFPSFRGHY